MTTETREDTFYAGLAGEKVAEPVPAPSAPEPTPQVQPPTVRPVTERNLFENPDSHPVLLNYALLKAFQMEWFPWLSDTLFSEIEQTFRTSIADVNRLKIMAVQTLHVIDAFWEEWEIFEKTINALGNIPPLLTVSQPPDLPLLLSGVDIANQIRKEEFSEEVARYTAACFLFENVQYAPPPCDFAQAYISQPVYRCKDCGRTGSALAPFDGYCDTCTLKFEGEHPFSFKPDEGAVKRGLGRNLDYTLTYDPEPTKKRFQELDALPQDKLQSALQDTGEDVQSIKLISAVDYMKFRQKQLNEQLVGISGWLGHQ